jgi:gliding motility-associated-like protein
LQRNPGVDVSVGTNTPLFSFSWDGDNVKLEPGASYEARWEGSGEQLLDSGQIRLRLCYPCGISEEGPLRLDNGDTPVSETTVEIDGKVFRDFIFDLPLSNGTFIGRMPLSFSCDAPCLDSVPVSQRTQIVTSCPNVTSSTNDVKLGVCGEVFLAPCPGQSDCGYFILGETFARIECEKGPPRRDTVSGYVLLDGQGQRTSLGFVDENDDRRVDGPMTTDQADVRRSIFGDTLVFDFAGEVKVDFGPVLDSLVLKVQPGFDIEFISSKLRYVEAATGREWECDGLPGEVVMDPPSPGVCCEISFSKGGAEPLSGKVEVTQRILDMIPCDVENFQIMDGDSFFFQMVVRNVHHRDIIERFDVNQKAEVYDSEVDELRFSCDAIVTPMLLTTSLFDLRSVGSGPLFVCDTFNLDYGWWIDPSAMTDNFFNKEVRPLTRMDEVIFEVDQELEVRSMVILGVYRDSVFFDTLFQERFLPDTLIDDAYVFSFDLWDSLVIDEGIDIFIYPEVLVRECQGIDSDVDISMTARIEAIGGHEFVVWPQLQEAWSEFTFSSTRLLRINRASLRADVGNTTITATEDSICLIIGVTVDDNLKQFDLYSLLDEEPGQAFDLRLPPGLSVLLERDSMVTIVPDRSGDFTIEVCYENSTCEPQRAEAGLSWSCGGSQPCYDSIFNFQIVKTDGELEMEVFSMPQVIDVCDTSDWIEVEIFSADLGSVYDLELTLMRNLGLEIAESSVEVQYPIGSMWRPVALPVNFQGTDLTWELDEDVLGRRSLPGIQGAPFNVVRLRFKAIADCGISDGSFFSMVLRGRGPCGEPTNEVRGSSGLLNIEGLPSALRQTLEVTSEAGCGEEVILDIRLFSNDPSTGEEGLRILLDPPLNVLSVDGRHGISSNAPTVIDTQGARLLLFQPDRLLSGDSVHLVLTLGEADRYRCDSVRYDVTSSISATRFCPSKMADCEVNVVNAIQSGFVLIPGFGVNAEVLGFDEAENCLEVRLGLERFGLDTVTEPVRFEVKVDDNGDGRSDPNEEVFLETFVGPEDLLKDSICLAFAPRDVCAFTMSYSGPCICSADTFSISLDRQLSDSIYLDTCLGEGLRIIPPAVPFDTLVWSGLVYCDTCGSIDLMASKLEGRDTSVLVLDIIRSPQCDYRLTYFIVPQEKENGLKEVVEVCMGDPVQLVSRFDRTLWVSDSLVFEGNNYVFTPEMDMDILAISQNGEQCSRPDTFCVRVQPLPELQVAPDDSTIFLGDTIGLEAIFSDGDLLWSPDEDLTCTSCPDPLAYPETTTTYIVKLTDANGCMSVDSITLRVLPRPCTEEEIFVPNAFSPNGDFINDEWRVRGKSIERLHVVVYNRWGELVFESTDPDFSWDGTYKGQALTTDVFAYAIEVDCVGGERFFHKGNLSLLR